MVTANGVPPMRARYLHLLLSIFAALAILAAPQSGQAQDWPQRPVKIVVPFAAGGNADGVTRIIAQRLGEIFGQQFVVENRVGGAGVIAAEAVARAPADGYTLFMASPSQLAISPAMTKTPYDATKDFAPVSLVGANSLVLLAHPSVPGRNLMEFVEHARQHPNKLSYAASGVGSVSQLSMALFLKRAGIELTAIAYRGGATPITDLIAGHVQTYFTGVSDALPHAGSGALKLLAVSSDQRLARLSNVPTFGEAGFPGFKIITWNGLVAPAGTPKAVIDRIAREVARAVKEPQTIERLNGFGVDPVGSSAEEFAAQLTADIRMWGEAVKLAGLQTQ